jgi:hypothetical protein
MPYKIGAILRGERSLQSEARRLAYSTDRIGNKEDEALIAAVHEIELECYRLAKQAQDFAAELRGLPRCTLCGHMTDRENPHEECADEATAG